MSSYSGRYPANTFQGILNVDNGTTGVDATLRQVQGGNGQTIPMQVSSIYVNITALQYNGYVVSVAGALSIAGPLTFAGANTVTITSTGTTNSTLPSGTHTLVGQDTADTLTNKTITSPTINTPTINTPNITGGSQTSVTITGGTFTASDYEGFTITAGSGALTFQGGGTYVSRTSTDTLTNKTYDTAATGNVFKINGTTVSGSSGTGSVVFSNSPTLVTPALGTPNSGVLTNCTGYTNANLPSKNTSLSSSCGNFSGGGGAGPNVVTNLSVSITTSGRPVLVAMIDDSSGNGAGVITSTGGTGNIYFFRGATQLSCAVINAATQELPLSSYQHVDFPTAGTYTYTVQYSNATNSLNIRWGKLVAIEL